MIMKFNLVTAGVAKLSGVAKRFPRYCRQQSIWLGAIVNAGLLLLSDGAAVAVELGVVHLPPDQVQLTVNGGNGRWHRIEMSTNLVNWVTLTSFYQSNSASVWVDSGVASSSHRYYRSRDLSTALDRYVAAPDTNYSYTLLSTISGSGRTTYVLELRSQAWLTTNEVDRVLWKHWLIIVKPTVVTNSQSLLFIDGGSNPGTVPSSGDPQRVCMKAS